MTTKESITPEEYAEILIEIVDEEDATNLLLIDGVFELVLEEYNNEVLDRWSNR